ncbi:Endonuclease/exonuclease/phosphatase [Scenedesmus sp. NREL 46B-D3]|nr:Endonuclease/exonuclease/phosphatase [Scenedesmus sp. NREL 46B-D3]
MVGLAAEAVQCKERSEADGLAQSGDFFKGYSCFFRAKKPSPALKFGFPADGIALFYRHSRFSASPAPSGHCFASMDGQPAAQGFVTALLHDKQSGRSLLVAATHLKAKAGVDNEQTRVHQACQLLQELENVQERQQVLQLQQQPPAGSSNGASSSRGVPPAVLLCGDFNTTPDSETVQVIAAAAAAAAGGDDSSSSSSSSSPVPAQEGDEFTTWKFRSTGAVKRTIDYIWYSEQQLAPTSRWLMLSELEIGPEGLPSKQYPSDHMSWVDKFQPGWYLGLRAWQKAGGTQTFDA